MVHYGPVVYVELLSRPASFVTPAKLPVEQWRTDSGKGPLLEGGYGIACSALALGIIATARLPSRLDGDLLQSDWRIGSDGMPALQLWISARSKRLFHGPPSSRTQEQSALESRRSMGPNLLARQSGNATNTLGLSACTPSVTVHVLACAHSICLQFAHR